MADNHPNWVSKLIQWPWDGNAQYRTLRVRIDDNQLTNWQRIRKWEHSNYMATISAIVEERANANCTDHSTPTARITNAAVFERKPRWAELSLRGFLFVQCKLWFWRRVSYLLQSTFPVSHRTREGTTPTLVGQGGTTFPRFLCALSVDQVGSVHVAHICVKPRRCSNKRKHRVLFKPSQLYANTHTGEGGHYSCLFEMVGRVYWSLAREKRHHFRRFFRVFVCEIGVVRGATFFIFYALFYSYPSCFTLGYIPSSSFFMCYFLCVSCRWDMPLDRKANTHLHAFFKYIFRLHERTHVTVGWAL